MTLPQLWALVAVGLPMVVVVGYLGAIDLAYHIRAGDLMLHTQSLLRTDRFSFTAGGSAWLNQQWGAQVVLALVFKWLGWAGLAMAHAVLVGTIFLFVYLACRAKGPPARISAWVSLAAFAASLVNLSLRPQLLGMAFFALALWLVVDRKRHPLRFLAIPVLVAVWANVHGSFIFGPLLAALAWVEDRRERPILARRTLLVGIASVAASFLNPFGPHVWSYVISLSRNSDITAHVVEWQAPSVRGPGGALFFLSVAAVAGLLARRQRLVPWTTITWLGVFFLIGLTAIRSTAWWALAAAPPVAGLLVNQRSRPHRALPASALNTAIAFLLVIPSLALFPWSLVGSPADSPGKRVPGAPVGLTRELQRLLQPGDRIFNAQAWGSWFEFALPRNPVFVDSRIELFPHSIWEQYRTVSNGRQGWQAILGRWRVRAVVVSSGQQESLIPLIRRDSGWTLAYKDDDGLIFLRR